MSTDARTNGKRIVRESVPAALWAQNEAFSNEIAELISNHALTRHPLINNLSDGGISEDALRLFHLEFRYAFSQRFTDAVMHTMLGADELEARLGATAKIGARFLLGFNLLDELGFAAGTDGHNLQGSPADSHFVMFNKTMLELGIDEAAAQAWEPAESSKASRSLIEDSAGDYMSMVTVLMVIETIFEAFAGPWSKNMRTATEVEVDGGYHAIHVDAEGVSVDDDHAEDLWYVFRQAVTPDRYDDVRVKATATLDNIVGFIDGMIARAG